MINLKKIFERKRKSKSNKFRCIAPFLQLFLYSNGDLSCCPISSAKNPDEFPSGNLNSFFSAEFNNHIKTKLFKENVINNDFKDCHFLNCYNRTNFYTQVIVDFLKRNKNISSLNEPQIVIIGDDIQFFSTCERREIPYILSNSELKDKTIRLLSNAKELVLSFKNEIFSHTEICDFIKEVVNKYPEIKFSIVSSGVLFDKLHCDELGITDRLSNICLLVNAASSQTYHNADFELLKSNIEWIASLKAKSKLNNLFLSFNVDEKNYHEMPLFVEFAKKYGAFALFRRIQNHQNFEKDLENSELIFSPKHKDYYKFVDILSSNELNTEFSALDSFFNLIKDKY